MALYGSIDHVKKMLRPDEAAAFKPDADARLVELRTVVSLQIDEETGYAFGGTATPTERTVDGPIDVADDVLLLPTPVRSVTSVAITGPNAATLPSTDWVVWIPNERGGYHALKRIANGWWPTRNGVDRIAVTAVWGNAEPGGAVPGDITYVANYLIAEHFKIEQASPAGFTGPDGATVPIGDPWKKPIVVKVLRKYGAATRFVGF